MGDEVLSGHVADANGPLLAAELRGTGHHLRRLATVGDDVEIIAREVQLAKADGCQLIITSGGVGPTHDDVTLEGVARGLDRELVECLPMRERIDGWIKRAGDVGIAEDALGAKWLRRMAMAPKEALLLECSIPVPAFAISDGEATVCVLPGPPSQFASAFRDAVLPLLKDPSTQVIEEVRHTFPESMLAQFLADLVAEVSVAIGSYPVSDGVLLRIKGEPEAAALAAQRLSAEIARLGATGAADALRKARLSN